MTYRTALVMHEACGRHDTGWAHPEHQGRLPGILNAIYRETPALLDHVLQCEGELITEDDILRAHSVAYLDQLRRAAKLALETGRIMELDSETLVSPASWEAALAAAGCVVSATRLVLKGTVPTAFALSRPPGHHATEDVAMGFCLLNNVAIAARWARTQGVDRVMIVDWDVHHGNGTQDIFYRDPAVYYLSLHQFPLYPGTGYPEERGIGAALNTNRNVQVVAGTAGPEYLRLFRDAVDAALAEFSPELVLVSAGFDVLRGDPLGGLHLEPADLHAATRYLMERMARPAQGRLIFALEGGYAPDRVGRGVVDVLRALADQPPA
ncbi:MAG TPA: histone deacetylase [Longimicrobiales bacterium]|nr:histone deacetylase [Longimicrobiales bacterium]